MAYSLNIITSKDDDMKNPISYEWKMFVLKEKLNETFEEVRIDLSKVSFDSEFNQKSLHIKKCQLPLNETFRFTCAIKFQ